MSSDTPSLESLPVKLIASVVVAACLILGLAGLVLPFLPGVVFLVVAAVVAARYWPGLDQTLRRNATAARYLDEANGLAQLPLDRKLQLACLLFVRALIEGVSVLMVAVTRLVRAAGRA